MQEWHGAAGICLNERNELLMVLQGTPEEEKTWSVPSGGLESGETYSECCLREIAEETGYIAEINQIEKVKKQKYRKLNFSSCVHYFSVNIIGGHCTIRDPDQLVYEVSWMSANEIVHLNLTYPEDRKFLLNYMKHHHK
nr:NUDIX hydrolase [Virgibacillus siamensis]